MKTPTAPYHVYIMASRIKTLYIGVTNNLERRVWEHKSGIVDGFTSKYNVNHLVYCEEYNSVRQAIEREKQIKAWRRQKKVDLIQSLNPEWDDIAQHWYSGPGDPSLRSG